MDAMAVALDIIHVTMEAGAEYEKTQIVLFSPFDSPFVASDETESAIVSALTERETELLVVSSIFDEGSTLLNHGGKAVQKLIDQVRIRKHKMSETVIDFTSQVNGSNISFEELLSHLLYISDKPTKSVPWNATLDIGNTIKIPISAYIKVLEDFELKSHLLIFNQNKNE